MIAKLELFSCDTIGNRLIGDILLLLSGEQCPRLLQSVSSFICPLAIRIRGAGV